MPDGQIPIGETGAMVEQVSTWIKRPATPKADNPFTLEQMLQKTLNVYNE